MPKRESGPNAIGEVQASIAQSHIVEIPSSGRIDKGDPLRIGVLLVGLEEKPLPALEYLIVHLNTVQSSFEFELVGIPDGVSEQFLRPLASNAEISRDMFRKTLPEFKAAYKLWLTGESERFDLVEPPPDNFIILSRAVFSDLYYSMRKGGVSVIGLGRWKKAMSPPTITEFFLTLLAREAIAMSCEPLASSVHFGAKGCLCDFTPELKNARLKALNSFLCAHCQGKLRAAGREDVIEAAYTIVGRHWIGATDDARSPAAISSKLGLDLFITKDLKPSKSERFLAFLGEESVKTALTLTVGIMTGVVVARLTGH